MERIKVKVWIVEGKSCVTQIQQVDTTAEATFGPVDELYAPKDPFADEGEEVSE